MIGRSLPLLLVVLLAVCNAEEFLTIRGPKPQYARVGEGSSVTCAINAAAIDSTWTLYVNGESYQKVNTNANNAWAEASFAFNTFNEDNGTVTTSVDGFIDNYKPQHHYANITCVSTQYTKKISLTINLGLGCPAGQYNTTAGNCVNCGLNSYSPDMDDNCHPCPGGMGVMEPGQGRSESDCQMRPNSAKSVVPAAILFMMSFLAIYY